MKPGRVTVYVGLQERVVKMTGDIDQLMRAVALVVTKLR
jgi:hypothetical protein